jgi:ferredoxin
MAFITTGDIDGLHGHLRSVLLPITYLDDVKKDIVRFRETERLNGFQKWITYEGYVLDVPALPFEAKSIVLAASKHRLVDLLFHCQGKIIRDFHCLGLAPLRQSIEGLFSANGYHTEYVYWLPQKLLAVSAGLAEYGRNNITYTDDWGSWFELLTFFTDMPCADPEVWRGAKHMDGCETCFKCLNACPTQAIREDAYFINNERCTTLYIESDKPFPDFIPPEAVESVIGCRYCQDACPKNAGKYARTASSNSARRKRRCCWTAPTRAPCGQSPGEDRPARAGLAAAVAPEKSETAP